MAVDGLRVTLVEPGPAGQITALTSFGAAGEGYVTSIERGGVGRLAAALEANELELSFVDFGHLAGQVCRWTGLPTLQVARQRLVEAAVADACREMGQIFALQRGRLGVARAVARSLRELRYLGRPIEELRTEAFGLEEPVQSRVLELLSLLDRSDQTLRMLGREHVSDQLMRALGSDLSSGVELPARLLVFGIDEAMPLERRWLEWLASAGSEVWVAQAGAASSGWAGQLFSTEDEGTEGPPREGAAVTIASTPDRLSECEWALRGCHTALAEGLEPHEVAIFVRDEAYAPLLASAAERLRLPIRLHTRAALLSNRLAAFVLLLLRGLASPDVRDLIEPLESPYAELGPGERRLLRGKLRECFVDPAPWVALEQWVADDGEPAWLAPVLDWRTEAIGEADGQGEGQPFSTALEWVERIRALIEILPVLEVGEHSASEWDRRAQAVMISSLSDEAGIEKVRARPALRFGEAVDWIEHLWDRADCSVPAADEGLLVATSIETLPGARRVFALGLADGRFPRRAPVDPVLPVYERGLLVGLGWPLEDLERRHQIRERSSLIRICAAASERLVLSYPRAVEGREAGPSSFLAEVASRTLVDQVPYASALPSLAEARLRPDLVLAQALEAPTEEPAPLEIGPSLARELALEPGKDLKVQELVEASGCAFKYQARRLEVDSVAPMDFGSQLAGLPRSVNLGLIETRKEALAKLEMALEERLGQFRGQMEAWEVRLARIQGKRYIRGLVEREFGAREIWPRTAVRERPRSRYVNEKVDGTETAVAVSFAAESVVESRRCFQVFRSSGKRAGVNLEWRLWQRFYALGAIGEDDATLVEMDSPDERIMMGRPKLAASAPGFKSLATPEFNRDDLTEAVERGIARAREGNIEASPDKDRCPRCDFGGLCRRSYYFPELQSEFDAGLPRTEPGDSELAQEEE